MSARGVYCVAFGTQARACAERLVRSIRKHMPDVPVAVCSTDPIGTEDVFVRGQDADVGARRAKLAAYGATPKEWQSVLYLDADTELVAPVYQLFRWCEDGWDFVICRDAGETLHTFQRKNNIAEFRETCGLLGSLYVMQYNGGVWAFRRGGPARRLMERWRAEYEVHLQRDQGALVRALHAEPLRLLVLGNEWNTIPGYTDHVKTAGVMHYPGTARRWVGKIPGRIDSPEAWNIVRRYQQAHG